MCNSKNNSKVQKNLTALSTWEVRRSARILGRSVWQNNALHTRVCYTWFGTGSSQSSYMSGKLSKELNLRNGWREIWFKQTWQRWALGRFADRLTHLVAYRTVTLPLPLGVAVVLRLRDIWLGQHIHVNFTKENSNNKKNEVKCTYKQN